MTRDEGMWDTAPREPWMVISPLSVFIPVSSDKEEESWQAPDKRSSALPATMARTRA